MAGQTFERSVSTSPPQDHLEKMEVVEELSVKHEAVAQIGVTGLTLMSVEVVQ